MASSQIEKVKRRRRDYPETLVEIRKDEYIGFSVDSIVDCNDVFTKRIKHLAEKLENGDLKMKAEMETSLVEKLRKAVIRSPLVISNIKERLAPEQEGHP
ncbi:MAG: hypothetical protein GY864_07545 [Desulfobacterales bacterium]|nr:hypothetical protein [Desulfobacterales bacterium]